jgi:molybdopterin-containing oxidoreductase family membrane subunit
MIAILTYGTVSLLFWYMGLVPDLATLRDRAKSRFARLAYGIFAAGWRNSARHWFRFDKAYFLMAALATPLVVSVHSIVSLDFAAGIVPGWHSTIFPPYFVLGALFSGFAMVLVIAIPLRRMYGLGAWITQRHLDNMAKIMLVSGLGVAYGYLMETFMALYSGQPVEMFVVANRALGPYGPLFWALIACNVLIPQLLWFPRVRANTVLLWVLSLVILTGMWLERFIIVAGSLARDWVVSQWAVYAPTIWDWLTFIGTLGLFFFLMFLFIRFLPMISIFEMRQLVTKVEEEKA